jgi:hypothetical protein
MRVLSSPGKSAFWSVLNLRRNCELGCSKYTASCSSGNNEKVNNLDIYIQEQKTAMGMWNASLC